MEWTGRWIGKEKDVRETTGREEGRKGGAKEQRKGMQREKG